MGLELVENKYETEQLTFDDFWSVYPRKQKRKEAQVAWRRIHPSLHQAVLSGVERWKRSDQWNRDGGQYIPMPTSFLNGERWTDEVEVGVSATICFWKGCKKVGLHKAGPKEYCEIHVQALRRGETP